jgi:phage terminase small subunit
MLNNRQKKFADEYMKDLNAKQAAIRAGYSQASAAVIGYENLRKPEIKTYLDEKLSEMCLGSQEAIKLISDIATSSLNDYFVIKMVEHTPRVKKSLRLLIKELESQILFEKNFLEASKLKGEEKKEHVLVMKQKELQLIRYQVELKYNTKATRIVDGETILKESVELDMVKLIADKERGRIKSISYSPSGLPRVEMYSAEAALTTIAKMHKLFKDDDEKKPLTITINGQGVKFS